MKLNHIYNEGCLETLLRMPDDFIDCCVTSPPYWGLRDYGVDGQLGLEKTPQEYVEKMRVIFAEVRRVLKPSGTCWLNLGDSYAGSGKGAWNITNVQKEVYAPLPGGLETQIPKIPDGLKPKDLVGIPWRVAFALQDDGWWLRQDIIWSKPNPMPESVKDRCTKAHEYVFLLTKSAKYWYDAAAISQKSDNSGKSISLGNKSFSKGQANAIGIKPSGNGAEASYTVVDTRNRRSVWTIPTQPYPDAHFAVYPIKLPSLCILAGCPKGGIVYDPFMGSGTTAEAALKYGRQFIGSELSPDYCKLAEKRIRPHLKQISMFEEAR